MWISAYFAENGSPKEGLSPTVSIIKLSSGSSVVVDTAMTEISNGFYRYNFSTVDTEENYDYICDSVVLIGIERYSLGSIESPLSYIVEGDYTLKDVQKIMVSALAGISSGGGTPNLTFQDTSGTTDRITAVVTRKGNRNSVVLDVT